MSKSSMQNGEDKTFTFRSVPSALHKAWKMCAAIAGISMEEFALTAIQTYIEHVMIGKSDLSLPSAKEETKP